MPPLFFVDQNGVPYIEDRLPAPTNEETTYEIDMADVAKRAEEEARKASTPKRHQ